MKICPNCNEKLDDNEKNCPNCHASVNENVINDRESVDSQVNKIKDSITVDTQPKQYSNNTDCNTQIVDSDEPELLLRFIAWFIPVLGIAYYFFEHKSHPKQAKSYALASLISIIVSIVLPLVIWSAVLLFGTVGFIGML